MNTVNNVYQKLKNEYDVILTTTLKLNDGYTIDVPVIRGTTAEGRFDLYREDGQNGLLVFSVEFFNKDEDDKYTHSHPYDEDMATEWAICFLTGRFEGLE